MIYGLTKYGLRVTSITSTKRYLIKPENSRIYLKNCRFSALFEAENIANLQNTSRSIRLNVIV